MKKRAVFFAIVLFLFTLPLTGCSESKGVPDALAIEFVGECEDYDPEYPTTYTVEHNYDSEAGMDSVVVNMTATSTYGSYTCSCSAIFQEHSSDGSWSLIRADEWSSPAYTYNNNLIGVWQVEDMVSDEGTPYTIRITQVSGNYVAFDYTIDTAVYGGIYNGDVMLHVSGSASDTVGNTPYLKTKVELPDNFYNMQGSGNRTAELYIHVGIDEGVTSCLFSSVNYIAN